MARKSRPVVLSEPRRKLLERMSRGRKRSQRLVERATMVVVVADGLSDTEQGRRLGVDRQRPHRWRSRWLDAADSIDEAEEAGASEHELVTANLEISTGKVVSPRIRETRTNIDFVAHIDTTTSDDPDGRWVFVVDHLDPHKSEELVRYVAAAVGHDGDVEVRRLEVTSPEDGVPLRAVPPDPLRLHAPALLLAEPVRVVVQRVGAACASTRQLHFQAGPPRQAPGVHRLLQRRSRHALPLDLHREARCGLTAGTADHPARPT